MSGISLTTLDTSVINFDQAGVFPGTTKYAHKASEVHAINDKKERL